MFFVVVYFRELILDRCKKVTDLGIRRLCVSYEDSGKRKQRRFLQSFSIYLFILFQEWGVIRVSASANPLSDWTSNLPKWRRKELGWLWSIYQSFNSSTAVSLSKSPLRCSKMVGIRRNSRLGLLEYANFLWWICVTTAEKVLLSLGWVMWKWMEVGGSGRRPNIPNKKGDLEAAIKLCPSAVHVEISCLSKEPSFTNEELKFLLNLESLCHFSIEGTDRVSFGEGLLPILEKFGPSTLENLELEKLCEVDVSSIAKYCSKLRSLKLLSIGRYISPSQPLKPQDNRLQRLKNLSMAQYGEDEDDDIPRPTPVPATAADLLILLSSPALVTLNFYLFDGLSDQVMEEAARLYGFPNLQEFHMEFNSGASITERSIDCLLTLDNPLKKIYLCEGEKIKYRHAMKWGNMAKKNNWDLSIIMYTWCCCFLSLQVVGLAKDFDCLQ